MQQFLKPVAGSDKVTLAPLTTAPLGSVTVPRNEVVAVCANKNVLRVRMVSSEATILGKPIEAPYVQSYDCLIETRALRTETLGLWLGIVQFTTHRRKQNLKDLCASGSTSLQFSGGLLWHLELARIVLMRLTIVHSTT